MMKTKSAAHGLELNASLQSQAVLAFASLHVDIH